MLVIHKKLLLTALLFQNQLPVLIHEKKQPVWIGWPIIHQKSQAVTKLAKHPGIAKQFAGSDVDVTTAPGDLRDRL